MPPTVEQVTEALSRVVDPNTGKDLVTGNALQNVRVEGDLAPIRLPRKPESVRPTPPQPGYGQAPVGE